MKSVSKNKRRPNWLLRSLICVSLGIHLLIFMHIAGVYRSRALTFIELTLKDISKPPSRSIPRPRMRPKTRERPRDVKRLNLRKTVIPTLKPMKVDPVERVLPDTLVERVSMPELPLDAGPKIAAWDPGPRVNAGIGDYINPGDYFDMIRLRIESYKRYPDTARIRQIEGRATVRFVIAPDGRVTTLKIVKSARNRALDRAALDAVRKASPFPRPPSHLFKGPIPLEITIVFELT